MTVQVNMTSTVINAEDKVETLVVLQIQEVEMTGSLHITEARGVTVVFVGRRQEGVVETPVRNRATVVIGDDHGEKVIHHGIVNCAVVANFLQIQGKEIR